MWGTHYSKEIEYEGLPVHPHACGELNFTELVRSAFSGSSPRMWGTHNIVDGDFNIKRFIPTHVGNSVSFKFDP